MKGGRCNPCISRLVELLRSEGLDAELSECHDEDGLKQRLSTRFESLERLLVPDAAGLVEVGGAKRRLRILVVVEEGGASSIHDIIQGLDPLPAVKEAIGARAELHVIIYHLEGKAVRTAARVHPRSTRTARTVLVSGCCSLTRHSIHAKLAKPLKELL